MPIRGLRIAPGLRLRMGESVLFAAGMVDTRLVKDRLARFKREHRRYADAHARVATIEGRVRAAQQRLSGCDAAQDDAVEALARALVGDGQPRRNPFAAFGAPSPSALTRLPFADEAKAVQKLVDLVRLETPLSKPTSEAARKAAEAARAVERAIVDVKKLEETLHAARVARNAIAHGWHSEYRALKLVARAAAADGAAHLHGRLFPKPVRKRKRRKVAAASGQAATAGGSGSPAPGTIPQS